MKIVVDAAQAKRQDAEYGGDLGVVMDRAGYAVAHAASALGASYGSRVAVLAGAGNNGGDAYIAARYLARRGCLATVHAIGDPKTPEAVAARNGWLASGGAVAPLESNGRADLIVDGVFGVGFHGELPSALSTWAGHAPVLAIDVPSGVDGSTGSVAAGTLCAAATLALSNYKVGHFLGDGPNACGRLELVDLGLPDPEGSLLLCEPHDAPRPQRDRLDHKWSTGSVAVVGGSAGMAGAAILAAQSALGFGAGAVAAFVPAALAGEIDAAHPEIMTQGFGGGASLRGADVGALLEAAARFDVLVVGPGLGGDVSEFVAELLARASQPIVLDADGLNAVTPDTIAARPGATVLTPHAGEFGRLAGVEASYEAAAELATATNSTVLLKGPATIVAAPDQTAPWLVTTGGRELATVGTGDVLAGMIAALMARGLEAPVAGRSGAYWHGVAGAELAATSSVTADRMAEAVRRFAS